MATIELKRTVDSDKFRQPALHYKKHECYTFAPPGTTEYIKYWTDEMHHCLHGFTAEDGDRISGFHYFYLNYFRMGRIDLVDVYLPNGEIEQRPQPVKGLPDFYDYDRYFFDAVEHCESVGKHMVVLKARRKGYSFKVAAMLLRNYYFIKGSRGFALASEAEYLVKDGILSKAWDAMDFIDSETAWFKKRQKADTRMHRRASFVMKDDTGVPVELGYKSEIMGVTLKNDSDKARGKAGKLIIFEEAGKFPGLLDAWQKARPSVEQGSYVHGTMIAFGTGGTEDANYEGLKELFNNPDGYNCLVFKNIWDDHLYGTECGFFIPQYANLEGQDPETGEPFMDENGNTNVHVARTFVLRERQKVIDNASDRRAIDRHVAEQPITPAEATLNISSNIFPKAEMERHLATIRNHDKYKDFKQVGNLLYNDSGGIIWDVNTKYRDINKYRLKPSDSREGSIVIWEHPVDDPPYGLYIMGCLLPGEKVITHRGLMNVEDVTKEERLLDIEGDLVNIQELLQYNVTQEEVYTLKMSNTLRTTTFTKEHPIYVSDHVTNKQNTIDEGLFKFDFKKASDIKEKQWVKYPNQYLNTDHNYEEHPTSIGEYNSDHWWFRGLWLGDGWVSNNRVCIAFDITNEAQLKRFEDYVKRYYGKELYIRQRNNTIEASFSDKHVANQLVEMFGKYAHSKKIPEWLKYEKNIIKQNLLLGYLDSDGCIYKDKREYYSLEYVSINLELLESIQDMAFSLGLVSNLTKLRSTGKYNIDGRVGFQKEAYHLRFGHTDTIRFAKMCNFNDHSKLFNIDKDNIKEVRSRAKQGCFISDDKQHIYFQIKKIDKSLYTGSVYNFETETHTFCSHHISTHNCDPYDHDQSGTDSLGSVIVYKRFQGFEQFYDMPVAEYTGRPNTAEEFYEKVRMLAQYYKAKVLYENEKKGLFSHFSHKHQEFLLADQPEIIKDVIQDMRVQRSKGVHMNTSIKEWGEGLIKDWLNEEYAPGKKNLSKIFSEPLLEELIAYNPDGNFDRVMAFMMVMIFKEELHHVRIAEAKKKNKIELFSGGIFRSEKQQAII